MHLEQEIYALLYFTVTPKTFTLFGPPLLLPTSLSTDVIYIYGPFLSSPVGSEGFSLSSSVSALGRLFFLGDVSSTSMSGQLLGLQDIAPTFFQKIVGLVFLYERFRLFAPILVSFLTRLVGSVDNSPSCFPPCEMP